MKINMKFTNSVSHYQDNSSMKRNVHFESESFHMLKDKRKNL